MPRKFGGPKRAPREGQLQDAETVLLETGDPHTLPQCTLWSFREHPLISAGARDAPFAGMWGHLSEKGSPSRLHGVSWGNIAAAAEEYQPKRGDPQIFPQGRHPPSCGKYCLCSQPRFGFHQWNDCDAVARANLVNTKDDVCNKPAQH